MSNNKTNDKSENNAVTAVEVVKDDTVMYEDGDFEDYNADQDYTADDSTDKGNHHKKGSTATDDQPDNSSDTSSDTDKDNASEQTAQSSKKAKSDKDNTSDESEQSEKDDNADKKQNGDKNDHADKSGEKDAADQGDKSGLTMAGLYQWASKLKDDFASEASDLTHGVTEKAAAKVLTKLKDGVDLELAAFDKSVEVAKELIKNAEERRKKIASKKDKYQDMIDKLDQ